MIHKCVAIRHAKSAERFGVDMISMDGFDYNSGHPGEMDIGNWVLFAKAVRDLSIPYVIFYNMVVLFISTLAAAIAMGAEGMIYGYSLHGYC